MVNLDELTQNRKLLTGIGRSELLEIVEVLLDERATLLSGLRAAKAPADRYDRAAHAYFNEAEILLEDAYHEGKEAEDELYREEP